MSWYFIALLICYIIICIALIIFIIMQKRRSSGLGNIAGLTDTYWNRNKKNSLEGKLDKLTKIFAAIFFIFTIITWFIK